MKQVPDFRVLQCNEAKENPQGDYVLYWMIANRRTYWNFGLQRAVEWSNRLGKPLMILEALRCGYQWASDRIHRFVMDGMKDNAARLQSNGVFYYPYLEPDPGAGKGLLHELAKRACVVVTDDFPCFFLPRMISSAARQVSVSLEQVDSNGLLPIRWTDKVFSTAFSFRRFLQKELEPHLHSFPVQEPLLEGVRPFDARLPSGILEKWPPAHDVLRGLDQSSFASFPIDHSVPAAAVQGGEREANRILKSFLQDRMDKYADYRNHPDDDATSALSPYLRFGHISAHQVFHELMDREGWSRNRIFSRGRGQREGWWGVSRHAESFIDQLVTWRELGYNACAHLSLSCGPESLLI